MVFTEVMIEGVSLPHGIFTVGKAYKSLCTKHGL